VGAGALSLQDAVKTGWKTPLDRGRGSPAPAAGTRIGRPGQPAAKLNYNESFARSTIRFRFQLLLTQHQFTSELRHRPLNRPDFLNNFQFQLTWPEGLRRRARSGTGCGAELGEGMAGEENRGPGRT